MTAPFPATVVADPEAQLNFEALSLLLPQGSQQILQAGSGVALASTGTARRIDFGSTSVTFSASSVSSVATVTHALGANPVVVILTLAQLFTTSTNNAMWGAPTTTTFQVQMTSNVAQTATLAVSWVAIG